MNDELLFNKYGIFGILQNQPEAVKKRIQAIPAATLLNASEHDLVEALIEEFHLNVPVIDDDDIYIAESGEAQVDVSRDPMHMIYDRSEAFYVPGNKTVIAVPFKGDVEFFRVQPSSYSLSPPRATIGKGELLLTYVRTDQNAEAIKSGYQGTVNSIKQYLRSLSESAAQFNGQLENLITSELKTRKDRLLADAGMTSAIGLPMKKRAGVPDTYSVPVSRRVPKVEEIRTQGSFKPEPALSNEDYLEILRIMKNMVQVMELSPHAFSDMGEEDLRFHFLVQLNGAFQGQATGETFNFQGKTDILIRVDGKSIFIGECKFWKGEKAFLATVDQLLSYLSWRDTKTSVIIFNRNADFTAVLSKIAEALLTTSRLRGTNPFLHRTDVQKARGTLGLCLNSSATLWRISWDRYWLACLPWSYRTAHRTWVNLDVRNRSRSKTYYRANIAYMKDKRPAAARQQVGMENGVKTRNDYLP